AVVRAVLDGRADAGTVRTDTLERMAETGLIELERIKLLNPMPVADFPYRLSTRLYPEWPMAALKHVPHSSTFVVPGKDWSKH
ncbi:MAG: PhnD/SsuA/transferrin family substrate-binding protein, partial [Candidatus Thiodiazotropha endolucinida]